MPSARWRIPLVTTEKCKLRHAGSGLSRLPLTKKWNWNSAGTCSWSTDWWMEPWPPATKRVEVLHLFKWFTHTRRYYIIIYIHRIWCPRALQSRNWRSINAHKTSHYQLCNPSWSNSNVSGFRVLLVLGPASEQRMASLPNHRIHRLCARPGDRWDSNG